MYTATVQLAINNFVPMNGAVGQSPTIDATISPPKDTSPNAPTGVFSGDGQSIIIKVPKGYQGSVELTFQLPDPNYALLGLGFMPVQGGNPMREFRTIVINRDPSGSQLTVTDACLPKYLNIAFDYVILIQHLATGNIGLIDPDIEAELPD